MSTISSKHEKNPKKVGKAYKRQISARKAETHFSVDSSRLDIFR
jgi:hypothetical protein